MLTNSPTSSKNGLPFGMVALGYAGLIPFIVSPALQYLNLIEITILQATLNAYAFGIISFMCGTWWRAPRQPDNSAPASSSSLILSNILFLIALFAFILIPKLWPAVACALFLLLFVIEHYTPFIGSFTLSYKRMRRVLSVVASISMLSSFLLNGA